MSIYLGKFIPNFLLQYFAKDKILHFSISFVLIFIFFWIRKYILKQNWFLRIIAFSLRDVLIIWLAKEIIDSLWFWNAEFLDFFADFSWAIIPIYLFSIIKLSSKLKQSRKLKFENKLISRFKQTKKIDKKIKLFIFLSIIWFLNIFYLILKIPVLALKETFFIAKKMF